MKMDMFRSVLEAVPETRSQIVNELDIPEIPLTPYIWCEETVESDSSTLWTDNLAKRSISSNSSLALSRAMTDSEIDYDRYRRFKSRSLSDPWLQMRTALEEFPPGYLDSLKSFQETSSVSTDDTYHEMTRHSYNEELKLKMERFFEEECRVFSPDDPDLTALEDALKNLDLKESDTDSSNSKLIE